MASTFTVLLYPYVVVMQGQLYTGDKFPHAVLHDPRREDRFILEPSLEIGLNKAGSMTFTVTEKNPFYQQMCLDLQWEVVVLRDSTFVWAGFPVIMERDLYGNATFTCEGVLSYLNLVHIPPFRFESVRPSTLFYDVVFRKYMSEIKPDSGESGKLINSRYRHRNFAGGSYNGFDVSETRYETKLEDGETHWYTKTEERKITRYSKKTLSAMDVLQTRLVDYFGGNLYVGMNSDPESSGALWNINYTPDDEENRCSQTIEEGKNILELNFTKDETDFCTAVVPTNESGDSCFDASNSGSMSISDGKGNVLAVRRPYSNVFRNVSLVKKYGVITDTCDTTEGAVTEQIIGETLVKAASLRAPHVTYDVKAIDLSLVEGGSDWMKPGKYVHVISRKRGLDSWLLVDRLSLRLDDPTNNMIELGGTIS